MKRAAIWAGVAIAAITVAVVGVRAVSDARSSPLERAELAVVDRPPTSADRGPEVQSVLKLLKETGTKGAHTDAARLLSGPAEETAILVPIGEIAERDIPDEEGLVAEGLCLFYGSGMTSHQTCGGLHELRHGEIAGSGATWSGEAVDEEPPPTSTPPDPALVGALPEATHPIDPEEIPKPPRGTPTHFYGLVPDGVARVVVTFSGSVPDASATVTNNFYDAASTHPEASNRTGPVRWLDEDGRVVGPAR